MKVLQNLHIHSTYCDGKDTPEEIVLSAIDKGFHSIGFSGHAYIPAYGPYTMSVQQGEKYKKEISRLQDKYKDKIEIFLGIEADMYAPYPLEGYEYVIGTMHCLKKGNTFLPFDCGEDVVKQVIEQHFVGNGMAFAKEYYRQVASLPEYGKYDIIGHIDTITRNIEKEEFFDINAKEYVDAALGAMEAMRDKIPVFEVNTGAIARGYRTMPYPAKNLLGGIRELGFGAIISSDCHDARYLDCGYDLARSLLLESGFREYYVLTKNGFEAAEL